MKLTRFTLPIIKLLSLIYIVLLTACTGTPIPDVKEKPSAYVNTVSVHSSMYSKTFISDQALADYVLPNADIQTYEGEFFDDKQNLIAITSKVFPGASIITDFNQSIITLLFPTDLASLNEIDHTNAYIFFQPEPGKNYLTSEYDDLTSIQLNISSLGDVGERISGSYEATVCLTEAIQVGKCNEAENRLTISGHFDTIRGATRIVENQGTQEQPVILGDAPVKRTDLFVSDVASFYKVNVHPRQTYRISSIEMAANIEIHAFFEPEMSNVVCTINDNTQTSDKFCDLETGDHRIVYLRVINDAGDIVPGRQFGMNVENIGPFQSVGTSATPSNAGVVRKTLEFTGTVSADTPSYFSTSMYPKEIYTVTLKNLSGNFPLQMAIVEPGNLLCSTNYQCMATAETGAFFIVIESTDAEKGARFQVVIEERGSTTSAEGSLEAPIDIAGTSISGQTGNFVSSSFYRLAVEENTNYSFHYPGTQDHMVVTVLDNASAEEKICNFALRCVASSTDGDGVLLINVVSLRPQGSRFTLNMEKQKSFISEGSIDIPVDINESLSTIGTFTGQLSGQASYYQFNVTPDAIYTFNFTDISDKDMAFSISVNGKRICAPGFTTVGSRSCSAGVSGDTVDVMVRSTNIFTFAEGDFVLSISEGGSHYDIAGTKTLPMDIAGDLPIELTAQQTNLNYSYYNFPVTAGQVITVSLTNITGDNADIWVSAGDASCQSNKPGLLDDSCEITIPANVSNMEIITGGTYIASGSEYTLRLN